MVDPSNPDAPPIRPLSTAGPSPPLKRTPLVDDLFSPGFTSVIRWQVVPRELASPLSRFFPPRPTKVSLLCFLFAQVVLPCPVFPKSGLQATAQFFFPVPRCAPSFPHFQKSFYAIFLCLCNSPFPPSVPVAQRPVSLYDPSSFSVGLPLRLSSVSLRMPSDFPVFR